MTKLTDLQSILLSTASRRSTGQLLPAAESVTTAPDRVTQAIGSLLKRSLVEEVLVSAPDQTWRVAYDQRYGVVVNDAGRRAIGVEPEGSGGADGGSLAQTDTPAPSSPRGLTKATLLLSLLRREQGATLAELIEATGWLPHTVRAALTGVRKKGHTVVKSKRSEETCYTVAA